jgi:hypothetical protein
LKDQKYEALKAHAEEKLEEANKEIENIARSQVPSRHSQGFGSGSVLIWLSWSRIQEGKYYPQNIKK